MPRFVGMAVGLAAKVLPKTPTARLDAHAVSRDPRVVERYEADPLVYHGRLRAGFAAAFARANQRIGRDIAKFELPVLLIHGGADTLVSPDASRWLAENVSSDDVTLDIYEGLYHEVLNEPERGRVIEDLVTWVQDHIAASGEQAATA